MTIQIPSTNAGRMPGESCRTQPIISWEDQTIDHPEVRPEWIEATIIRPHHQATDIDGNELFYGSNLGAE